MNVHEAISRAQEAQKTTWPTCVDCGTRIDPQDTSVLREVRGWACHRDAGGQNHVIARTETGRLMCGECSIRLRTHVSPEQGSLL